MNKFRTSRKAISDLLGIGRFTEEKWGTDQRNAYLKQLDSCFKQLAKNPQIGIQCDYILPGYRKFPQGSHLIFYRTLNNKTIEIVRVLHKSMDVDSKF